MIEKCRLELQLLKCHLQFRSSLLISRFVSHPVILNNYHILNSNNSYLKFCGNLFFVSQQINTYAISLILPLIPQSLKYLLSSPFQKTLLISGPYSQTQGKLDQKKICLYKVLKPRFVCLFVLVFRAAPVAYGGSQARGQIGTAAGLRHSHSNPESQCQILNPLIEARDRTHNLIVPSGIHFCCTTTGTPKPSFKKQLSYILN